MKRGNVTGSNATINAGMTISLAAGLMLAVGGAQAQNADGIEELVVTGTRIANPNAVSSSPVSVISANEIALTGSAVTLERVLNQMPQFTPGRTANTATPADRQIIATADLRGLGAQRTLVLVNGTRYVPANAANVIDLNTIPSALIERVDVVTGGASAVYGSDAIAGVVNFRLRENFEGVELRASGNLTSRNDGFAGDVGGTIGGNFADDRGNVVLDITYSKRNKVLGYDRYFAAEQLNGSTCAPGTLDRRGAGTVSTAAGSVPCLFVTGSGTLPAGTINNNITFDRQGNPISPRPAGLIDNFFGDNYLQLPIERWTSTSLGKYDFTDNIQGYGRFVYTGNQSSLSQRSTSTAGIANLRLNLDNPFVRPALRTLLTPTDTDRDGIVEIALARRFLETGPRDVVLNQDAFQTQVGLRGDISATWKFDSYYQYGRNHRNERFANDIAFSKLQQSLLAVTGANGQPVCINPANGCVPANIFGEGNVSAASAAFLRSSGSRITDITQQVAGAYAAGSTDGAINLPAGPIDLVFGVEWRDIKASENPDFFLQAESIGTARQFPTGGDYNVKEVYGEMDVPLLKDMTLAQSLSLKGAVRYSDYSLAGVGGATTWNAGAAYEPVDDLRIRGEFQRAIRAPNVQELFQGRQSQTATIVDPCGDRSAVATRTPERRALCIANGVPAAAVFTTLQPGNPEIRTEFGGNPNLRAEASDTYTVGASYEPSFVEGLSLSADYYNIKIDDAIALFGGGTANIINLCFNTIRDANSIYCRAIVRNPTTGVAQATQGDYSNVAIFKTSGIDFQATQTMPLDFGFGGEGSDLTVDLRGTHVRDKTIKSELASDTLKCAGLFGSRCGEPTPSWRMITSVNWATGPYSINLKWRWLSKVRWDGQYVFANDLLARAETFNASTRIGNTIPSYSYFDLAGQWDVNESALLTLGVENLLDKDPPIVGDIGQTNNTWPSTYDIMGTKFFAAVKIKL